MSVLRFRQLSTRRFYVPLNELNERCGGSERCETAARPLELTVCAGAVSGLPPVPRGGEVMEAADELLLLAGEAEDRSETARGEEVLPAFEGAFGVPERSPHPVLARWPLVVHGRPS
jgi:hypothetical protein